ncbi:hypothetical protein BCU70_01880 [Vibrio sp. 10N.286.49.C2]|nr:hypothetical protein BCU70_01880 [Vibrio sp. 10N.286.49.C2]PMH53734.1 hypothetical protein BCU66_12955 [Vibrio sp. 10N.286.49.B1]PMH81256.1 hypothetical protein BCU58_21740 [Vibrio sp. 10N.286.48.B7]
MGLYFDKNVTKSCQNYSAGKSIRHVLKPMDSLLAMNGVSSSTTNSFLAGIPIDGCDSVTHETSSVVQYTNHDKL